MLGANRASVARKYGLLMILGYRDGYNVAHRITQLTRMCSCVV